MVINLSVVRELGPVLAGVMLAGRVGGSLTAELGTMNVTEQIEALRSMGTDPIRYLVVPRFLACMLVTPLLTLYADLLGVKPKKLTKGLGLIRMTDKVPKFLTAMTQKVGLTPQVITDKIPFFAYSNQSPFGVKSDSGAFVVKVPKVVKNVVRG